MTQEDKQLLLQDLCARLPYGVKVQDELGRVNKLVIGNADLIRLFYNDFSIYGENALSLPLLRPMSSMTDEEKEYLKREFGIVDIDGEVVDFGEFPSKSVSMSLHKLSSFYKWLDSNYFDYHGLIEKGLALQAPEGMYPYQSPTHQLASKG